MKKKKCLRVVVALSVLASIAAFIFARMNEDDFSPEFLADLDVAAPQNAFNIAGVRTSPDLVRPVRLEADGEPINIGKMSSIAHAGPWIAKVDGDGDRDLLVGDFPGYFWMFENIGTEEKPIYTSKGQLKAGGEVAKTPVY